MSVVLPVVVPTPVQSGMGDCLSYRADTPLAPGTLVRVPLGQRELLGIVWDQADAAPTLDAGAELRPVLGALDGIAPLSPAWRELVTFAARYYQRALGEVALAALPPQLRELTGEQLARRLKPKTIKAAKAGNRARRPADAPAAPEVAAADVMPPTAEAVAAPALTPEQAQVIAQFQQSLQPVLLWGATGSGKTEVYLRLAQQALDSDPAAQVLVMVPEINLTPQLEERFIARLAPRYGPQSVVSLHSGMTPPQRLKSWLAAHGGTARVVLGTRMAIFASLPGLRLIVVDEEHDPSYKQQEGARYSARDLAVYRARQESALPDADGTLPEPGAAPRCRVLLGSATPSLESWYACERGRYRRLDMPSRIGAGVLPTVRRVDMNHQPRRALIAPPLVAALRERIARGEQSLIFLNRRGYAPVLHCGSCGWKSECPHCSAFRVFHKIDRTLRCHHCGYTQRVPLACPFCGDLDIQPLGRGTERIEEHLAELLAGTQRPDGGAPRIVRIDADTTKRKGELEAQLAQVHAGDVDVLVGTQMITKGHDFRRITLVAAINPDGSLFSSDFRAPERLFALLLQAAGRAGRDAGYAEAQGSRAEMWVQTAHPTHPLFEALKRHDYPAFAASQIEERTQAGLPPMAYQALVRADAKTQEIAQAFLNDAAAQADALPGASHVTRYPAVPMTIQRVANVERAQMLLESPSRAALQAFMSAWQPVLQAQRPKGLIRWLVDVDPLAI
ncbi:MAG: Primosomal protein N' [Paracidovorax wautersii]|uniref:Replication restart protein PriA n=1 Tax=Paracidovorax wautersii TaxID=1177982 RepID=A0A7V8FQF3_9BURK|nr:MAG: Primosomal protein N' [Paracidovorax wautersii]